MHCCQTAHDDVIKWKHFPRYWPVTRSFDVFFDMRPNKQWSKQWWGWWFKMTSFPLWRHCNDQVICSTPQWFGVSSLGISKLWVLCSIDIGVLWLLMTWCSLEAVLWHYWRSVPHHQQYHDDVIKWKQFPRYWPSVRGIHRSPVNSPHKGQWRGALMFSLICARINGWVNNPEAGYLRRHPTHCDVIVMVPQWFRASQSPCQSL